MSSSSIPSIRISAISPGESLERELLYPFSEQKINKQFLPIISDRLRDEIVSNFWPVEDTDTPRGSDSAFDPYFQYFNKVCSEAQDLRIYSYKDIIQLVNYLQENQNTSRTNLLGFFKSRIFLDSYSHIASLPYGDQEGYNSIDFCVRLWLMIDIGRTRAVEQGLVIYVVWKPEQSLKEALINYFPRLPLSCSRKARWPPAFQAPNLEQIGGFQLTWSNDIREHLSFNDEDPKRSCIYIFQHMTVIKRIQMSRKEVPFPAGLLDEMRDTVALLIRMHKPQGRTWFSAQVSHFRKSMNSQYSLDLAVGNQHLRLNALFLNRYQYWGEDLGNLKTAFDEREPQTLSQWWYDRRQKNNFWNLTLTIVGVLLAVLFGIAQTIIGAMQVYLIYHPPQT